MQGRVIKKRPTPEKKKPDTRADISAFNFIISFPPSPLSINYIQITANINTIKLHSIRAAVYFPWGILIIYTSWESLGHGRPKPHSSRNGSFRKKKERRRNNLQLRTWRSHTMFWNIIRTLSRIINQLLSRVWIVVSQTQVPSLWKWHRNHFQEELEVIMWHVIIIRRQWLQKEFTLERPILLLLDCDVPFIGDG